MPNEGGDDPWRDLFIKNLREVIGERSRMTERVLAEHRDDDDLAWTSIAITELDTNLCEGEKVEVLNRCAHVLPDETISELRDEFERSGSVRKVHEIWIRRFADRLISKYPDVPKSTLYEIIEDGWGEAGAIHGDLILATKVPQDLRGYLSATDKNEKAERYCHCGRVRDAFKLGRRLPRSYCNCGGGFYRYNWERIIGGKVVVEVRTSLMAGDDNCSFIIRLPVAIR